MERNAQKNLRKWNIADTDHEIFALIKQRWSTRKFKPDLIPETDLKKIFEAGRWASSYENIQPWRFIYAVKGSPSYTIIQECVPDNDTEWVSKAPVLVLTVYKQQRNDGSTNNHAMLNLGLCLGNMHIQAEYLGIAMTQLFDIDCEHATKSFGVPKGYSTYSVLVLGYYGDSEEVITREELEAEALIRKRYAQTDFVYKDEWKTF